MFADRARRIFIVGSALWVCACSTFAEEPVTKLPEVVVQEGQPGEQPAAQNAPGTVTELTATQIWQQGITSVGDIASQVPNLKLNTSAVRSFGDVYSIRGLHNTQLFSDPAVALYVDDAPYGNVFSYSTDLFDIDRIEVWRGPQGSAFGRNSEAGVINITTRQPSNRYQADAAFSYGSYDSQWYQVSLLGPVLTNRLYLSLAGVYSRSDGFVHNSNLDTDPDDLHNLAGRGTLRWTPASDWDVRLTLAGSNADDGTQRLVPLGGNLFKNASDFDGETSTDSNSQTLRIEHTAPTFTALSVTTRRDWQLDPFTLDLDLSPFAGNTALIKQNQTFWSEELRFMSPPDVESWKWLAGFFFSTAETDGDSTRNFFIPPFGPFATEKTTFTMDDDNYALFGHVTWEATERFAIIAGLRLDYTHKEMHRSKTSTFGPIAPQDKSHDYYNAAPKLTLEYRVNTNLLAYASTGTGFKPGGFSAFADPPRSPEYDTETVLASEIGLKSEWWNRKLIANLALFYNYVWDYQVERTITGTTDLLIFNAPEVESFGAEIEAVARPWAGWEFSGAFGYTHSTFIRYTDPVTGKNLDGEFTPYTPEFNASVAAQYKHPKGWFGRIQFVAVGQTFYDEANTGHFRQASYGLLNTRVGYERKHFAVYFFGNNVTDTEYYANKIVDLNAGVPGDPAVIGVMVRASY